MAILFFPVRILNTALSLDNRLRALHTLIVANVDISFETIYHRVQIVTLFYSTSVVHYIHDFISNLKQEQMKKYDDPDKSE